MKSFLYVLLRAVCAFVIGLLLVSNPLSMTTTIVQFIGAVFILLGLTQTLGYFLPKSKGDSMLRPIFPFVGLGSILLGVVLVLMPSTFVTFLMYLLGFFLILAGASQFISMVLRRNVAPLQWWLFVIPLLLFCAGLFILIRPLESASLPFIILGIGCLGYAVSELILGLRLWYYERQKQKEYVDFEPVEEAES